MSGGTGRAPTREELDSQLTATQQDLAKLREAQEQLERAKAAIEEMRRRRGEFHTGREEMLQNLLRGVALLEQAEMNLRRDALQMGRTLEGLRSALGNVQGLNEQAWTDTTWETELARSLAAIENARMEWNQARLAWSVLEEGSAVAGQATGSAAPVSLLTGLTTAQLARLGLAFNWPVALLGLGVFALAVVLALKR
jgi:DNA repair exonuclease SbcCD ATPase subunit